MMGRGVGERKKMGMESRWLVEGVVIFRDTL